MQFLREMERQAGGGDDDDDGSAARREAYKAEHESFVSGHAGSTPLEIMVLSLVVPVQMQGVDELVLVLRGPAGVILHRMSM